MMHFLLLMHLETSLHMRQHKKIVPTSACCFRWGRWVVCSGILASTPTTTCKNAMVVYLHRAESSNRRTSMSKWCCQMPTAWLQLMRPISRCVSIYMVPILEKTSSLWTSLYSWHLAFEDIVIQSHSCSFYVHNQPWEMDGFIWLMNMLASNGHTRNHVLELLYFILAIEGLVVRHGSCIHLY